MAQTVSTSFVHRVVDAILGLSPISACTQVQVCALNELATMLATKRAAGVTPELNLRNPLHAGDKSCKQGIHPGIETQGKYHQKSETGGPTKRTNVLRLKKKH